MSHCPSSAASLTSRYLWLAALLAVPLLYFASVPILWQKVAVQRRQTPQWLGVYMAPWMWLEDTEPFKGPMHAYATWVYERMTVTSP
jgi:hypothetical protein